MNVERFPILFFGNTTSLANIFVSVACLSSLLFPIWAAIAIRSWNFLRFRRTFPGTISAAIFIDFIFCSKEFSSAHFTNAFYGIEIDMIFPPMPMIFTSNRTEIIGTCSLRRESKITFSTPGTNILYFYMKFCFVFPSAFNGTSLLLSVWMTWNKFPATILAYTNAEIRSANFGAKMYYRCLRGSYFKRFLTAFAYFVKRRINNIVPNLGCTSFASNSLVDDWLIAINTLITKASVFVGFHPPQLYHKLEVVS